MTPLGRGKAVLLGFTILLLSSDISALLYIQWIAPMIEESLHAPIVYPFTYIVGFIGFAMYWGSIAALWTLPIQIGVMVFLYYLLHRVYGEKSR
jgi:hypothetical protein